METWKRQKQQRLRRRLDELAEELASCQQEFRIASLEAQVRKLYTEVEFNENDTFNLDSLLQQATEERERKKREDRGRHRNRMYQGPSGFGRRVA